MRNLTLAHMVVGNIQSAPDSFNMSTWGTQNKNGIVACLAGHTLLASGYRMFLPGVYIPPVPSRYSFVTAPDEEARQLLGLTDEEFNRGYHFTSCNLFCGLAREEDALAKFLQLIEQEEAIRAGQLELVGA